MNQLPGLHERERASNSYLMSLLAIMAGMPLPIINLLATFIFFMGNRNSSPFVRWHCTQALFSQMSLFFMNASLFSWTMSIIFGDNEVNNYYIAYLITAGLFNISDIVATIYSAIQVRKGKHVSWFFYGPLTDSVYRPI